ncbi:hypothetical protein AAFX24_28325 [Vibrio mediterranei]|uniref:hypothetical protein n=1 Tax=Vibrio mediterranei TaxID=689 RepID=UPI0038CDE82A
MDFIENILTLALKVSAIVVLVCAIISVYFIVIVDFHSLDDLIKQVGVTILGTVGAIYALGQK